MMDDALSEAEFRSILRSVHRIILYSLFIGFMLGLFVGTHT